MQYGSLVNLVQSGGTGKTPEVGMGVTFLSWSDRSPGTIQQVNIKQGKIVSIEVTGDGYVRTDDLGMSDCQSYDYIEKPESRRIVVKQDRNGTWRVARKTETGQMRVNKDCQVVVIGHREKYYDFSF